jgi:hypothetical protein
MKQKIKTVRLTPEASESIAKWAGKTGYSHCLLVSWLVYAALQDESVCEKLRLLAEGQEMLRAAVAALKRSELSK